MKEIEETTTPSFRVLFGNNTKYIVPKFQRDYSWGEEEWGDLWEDLQLAQKSNENHYMGYLVLKHDEPNKHQLIIIDGQQRITTICILILAAIGIFKEDEKERYDEFFRRYIGIKDPVTYEKNFKLELNRNNNDFYKNYLIESQTRGRGLNRSSKLMENCFLYFEKELRKKFSTGEKIAEFIEAIVDRMYFTMIKVNDFINAFKVFETLNARGVELSSADLLKNYFFSSLQSIPLLDELEEKWSQLVTTLGAEKITEFIRYYWNSQHSDFARKNTLFKTIKNSVSSQEDVKNFIDQLVKYADLYVALQNPQDEFWKEEAKYKDIEKNLKLLEIFKVKQWMVLALKLYFSNKQECFQFLKDCVTISFRYSIIANRNPNEAEKAYHEACLSQNHKEALKSIYLKDEEFEIQFKNKEFSRLTPKNKKIVRYILNEIWQENIYIEDEKNTIEHILPQNPSEEWQLEDVEIERAKHRLGNLSLLSSQNNQDCRNLNYLKKLEIYDKSEYKSSNKISAHYPEEWNEAKIDSRQSEMAKNAVNIWKINW